VQRGAADAIAAGQSRLFRRAPRIDERHVIAAEGKAEIRAAGHVGRAGHEERRRDGGKERSEEAHHGCLYNRPP
jgi:hypothetical protein